MMNETKPEGARETKLKGAYVVEPLRFEDERGFFARSWSLKDLPGWERVAVVESNVSFNRRKGTLRGMHYQAAPHGQAKLVRCTRGAIYDVIVDLRPDSPTFREWVGVELSAENRLTLCVPAEFAHGFQTLADDTELFYLVSDYYAPQCYRGARWNDPAFGIEWPHADERVMTRRDREYPDFNL
jgi:dTDP-4-dehydrorhamnose 3,5-epimerase